MNLARRAVLVVSLSLLATPVASIAGGTATGERPRLSTQRKRLQDKLIRIYPLLRSSPRAAIAQVQSLLEEYPGEKRLLLEKLGQAYAAAGEADSAIAVYKKCIAIKPVNLQAAGDLARIYMSYGRKKEAEALFDRLLDGSVSKLAAYRTIARAQMGAGFNAEALETFRRARSELGDPGLFSMEIADLEKVMGDMDAALSEYLNYLRESGDIGTVRAKIKGLVDNPKTNADRLVATLEGEAEKGELAYRQRVLSVLSAVHVERGLLERAVETALAADRMAPSSNGRPLFDLVERLRTAYFNARGKSRYELLRVALRACDAYVSLHPRTGESPRAYLMHAELLADLALGRIPHASPEEKRGAAAEALKTADMVMKNYPVSSYPARAALLKGQVLFCTGRKEEAIGLYRAIEPKAIDHAAELGARIAAALIAMGRREEATSYCRKLIESQREALAGVGRYYIGLLHAVSGEYRAARDTLTNLAESNPASTYTNDAIDVAWILEDGMRKDPELLYLYMRALQAEMAADTARAVAILERFADMGKDVPLRPRALERLGSWYTALGEYEKAASAYKQFLASYPDDSLAPEVEHLLGNLYDYWLGQSEPAMRIYEHILMAYPDYMFMDEVRRDVARLRSSMVEKSGGGHAH